MKKTTLSYAQATKLANDEDKARELVESLRWPDGPVCPHCQSKEVYRLTPKPESKRPVRKGVLKCKKCRKQFTVTVGTIFQGSHLPLSTWLQAISLMCSSKKGISAHQIHRMLGISYESAWFMCHRVRYGMEHNPFAGKMTGVIEVDETYVGPPVKGGKRGRGAEKKVPVVALVQRDGEVRSFPMERVDAKTLKAVIRENVAADADIMTDGLKSYRGLDKEFASHGVVEHNKGEYARSQGDGLPVIHTNSAEGYFALLKRGVHGTFHHISKTHLHRYCAEFNFRWTRRTMTDGERTAQCVKTFEGKRLQYHETTRKEKN